MISVFTERCSKVFGAGIGQYLLASVALLATLLFIVLNPFYNVHTHRWTTNKLLFEAPTPPRLSEFSPTDVTRHLITGGLSREPPSWLSRLPENLDYTYFPVLDNSTGYINKGHEAAFYLQYIIDHYNDEHLPDFMVFVHDHRRAWHNSDVADRSILHLLRDLQWDYVRQEGFVNLRCQTKPNCPSILPLHGLLTPGKMETIFHDAWAALFQPEFGEMPAIAATCCAQFVVSKQAVHQRPLQFYESAKRWILDSESSDWSIGRVFEYTWHIIFGKSAIHCPEQATCRRDLYGYERGEF